MKALLHLEVSVKEETKPGFLIPPGNGRTMHFSLCIFTLKKESA